MAHHNFAVALPQRLVWLVIPLVWLLAGVAGAADADPPGRVARVNFLEGVGSVQVAGTETWTDDLLNRPLTGGDRIWVDERSRAEMHVGSSALRLGARTAVQVVAVDDQRVRFSVTAGSVNVRIRSLAPGDHFEIATPAGDVALLQPGSYRVDVDDSNARAYVAIWNGGAEVEGPSGTIALRQQESAELAAGVEPAIEATSASNIDSLDLWAQDRDRREDQSLAADYVSREMVGYQDLDGYGRWVSEPSYGMVWVPVVAANWAPYHYGYWNWIGPWGWTWIASEPWGFAPCHYGRWVHAPYGWAWLPGPRGEPRPVYAPAQVAWRGERYPKTNPDLMHRPHVGWIPLGPNEIYVPPFKASDAYVRTVNQSNTHLGHTAIERYMDQDRRNGARGPDRRYVNESVSGAYSTAPREAFAAANPVGSPNAPPAAKVFMQPRITPHEAARPESADHPPARPVAFAPVVSVDRPQESPAVRGRFEPAPALDRPTPGSVRTVPVPAPQPAASGPANRSAQPVMRDAESHQAYVTHGPQAPVAAPQAIATAQGTSRTEQPATRDFDTSRVLSPAPTRSGESASHGPVQSAPAPVGRSARPY